MNTLHGADEIHYGGLFIGIHNSVISGDCVQLFVDGLLGFPWNAKDTILVTGGSGMCGQNLREYVESLDNVKLRNQEWIFASSKDCDLTVESQTISYFRRIQPTHVIHLAADVGGLYKNMDDKFTIGRNNVVMNSNVMKASVAIAIV